MIVNGLVSTQQAIKKLTAANTDMFSGTPLGVDREPGTWIFLLGSTVNTATFAVSGPSIEGTGQTPQEMELWANGVPPTDQAHVIKVAMRTAGRPIVAIAGTTGTIYGKGYYFQGVWF